GSVTESSEGNNACANSTVTVNTAASNTDLCVAGDVSACIALLIGHNGPQQNPPDACSGIDANFVIDRSLSISDSELSQLQGGITSFASALAGGSKFAGTQFSTTAETITSGYQSAATFNTAVNAIDQQFYTWTEGGIQTGAGNTANGTANPDMMFIVTDGSPNQDDSSGNDSLSLSMTWVNAANDAIAAANAARTAGFVVRAVYAGDPDTNMPASWDAAERLAFANAVLTGLGGGTFLSGSWDRSPRNLLQSAGCDPTVNKSASVPGHSVAGGAFERRLDDHADELRLAAKTGVLVHDANANNLISVAQIGTGRILLARFGRRRLDLRHPGEGRQHERPAHAHRPHDARRLQHLHGHERHEHGHRLRRRDRYEHGELQHCRPAERPFLPRDDRRPQGRGGLTRERSEYVELRPQRRHREGEPLDQRCEPGFMDGPGHGDLHRHGAEPRPRRHLLWDRRRWRLRHHPRHRHQPHRCRPVAWHHLGRGGRDDARVLQEHGLPRDDRHQQVEFSPGRRRRGRQRHLDDRRHRRHQPDHFGLDDLRHAAGGFRRPGAGDHR
ncbi:MAG: VWA domain-containing protein, partial [Dehalococcoidia bacterium]|nr:VWA domain-containing protein [Dehalococcoidia bacterium]